MQLSRAQAHVVDRVARPQHGAATHGAAIQRQAERPLHHQIGAVQASTAGSAQAGIGGLGGSLGGRGRHGGRVRATERRDGGEEDERDGGGEGAGH